MKILVAGNGLQALRRELEAGMCIVDAASGMPPVSSDIPYDCIVLSEDCCGSSFSGLTAMREAGLHTPVMCMLRSGGADERIAALAAGADDVMTMPCDIREAVMRVQALLRRRKAYIPERLSFSNIQLDSARSALLCGSHAASLTRLEYLILRLLIEHPGVSFSAETMLDRIWPDNSPADVNTVWVYISRLRRKMEEIGAKAMIHSRRKLGYSIIETR